MTQRAIAIVSHAKHTTQKSQQSSDAMLSERTVATGDVRITAKNDIVPRHLESPHGLGRKPADAVYEVMEQVLGVFQSETKQGCVTTMEEYSSILEPKTNHPFDATEPHSNPVETNCSLDGEHIEGGDKKKKRKQRRRPVTQMVLDQTSLLNAGLTIVDFLTAIGEPISGLQYGSMEWYMAILQLSFTWSSSAVLGLRKNNREGLESGFCHLSKRLGVLTATLCTDCARLEVEAISLLALIDSTSSNAPRQDQWDDDDDDGMTDEISALKHATVILREELSLSCSRPFDDGITGEISALEDATVILREELSSIYSLPTGCLKDGGDKDGGLGYSVGNRKLSLSAKAPTKHSQKYRDQSEEIRELNAKVCMDVLLSLSHFVGWLTFPNEGMRKCMHDVM